MFDNNRYITRGIKEHVDESIQLALWEFIDLLKLRKDIDLDYLQVFELREIRNNTAFNQEIIHFQEEPFYKRYYLVSVDKHVNIKIYVIDDGTCSTMLLKEEY
jgi:hypothetical protein